MQKICLELANKTEQISKMLKTQISCEAIKFNNTKTHYYTGLPSYKHFELCLAFIKQYMKIHGKNVLASEDQLLLTLMKLRLNLDYTDISYRFRISISTASANFKTTIHITYMRFKSIIVWPERAVLLKTMPKCFKESFHGKTAVIIDCFEIRCETPSNLLTAAQAWSNYKHSETIKYLIGITPQGSISYINASWGGRISDKCITQNSTFLQKLCPGDIIMADRKILIKEFVELFQATVKLPAFTRGKDQLDPVDLEETRSKSQSHHLLANRETNALLDEIVLVCCGLVNLCPSVVPLN